MHASPHHPSNVFFLAIEDGFMLPDTKLGALSLTGALCFAAEKGRLPPAAAREPRDAGACRVCRDRVPKPWLLPGHRASCLQSCNEALLMK